MVLIWNSTTGRCLRRLNRALDRHPQGLAVAMRAFRRRLSAWIVRHILNLDTALGVARHMTYTSCRCLEDEVQMCVERIMDDLLQPWTASSATGMMKPPGWSGDDDVAKRLRT